MYGDCVLQSTWSLGNRVIIIKYADYMNVTKKKGSSEMHEHEELNCTQKKNGTKFCP